MSRRTPPGVASVDGDATEPDIDPDARPTGPAPDPDEWGTLVTGEDDVDGPDDPFTYHHRLLYRLVRDAGTIPAAELHARYDDVAPDAYRGHTATPIGRRARRNKLADLRDAGLLNAEGEGPAREYWVTETVADATDPPLQAAIDALGRVNWDDVGAIPTETAVTFLEQLRYERAAREGST